MNKTRLTRSLFLFLLFWVVGQVHAQLEEGNKFYFTGEITAGNYGGIDIHANLLTGTSYSLKAGFSGHIRQPKSAPSDYSSGFLGAMSFGLAIPLDQLATYQVAAGKIFNFNKKGTIRANFSLGLGLTVVREPTNWEPVDRAFVQGNYTYDYDKYSTMSLILNPKIEFPFSRFYGLTLSPMIQINKDRMYIGIGIGQMLGLLR